VPVTRERDAAPMVVPRQAPWMHWAVPADAAEPLAGIPDVRPGTSAGGVGRPLV
jgi:hypothetical protein